MSYLGRDVHAAVGIGCEVLDVVAENLAVSDVGTEASFVAFSPYLS